MLFSLNQPLARVHRGFTLIELMIAVAIVGILVSVALPMYKKEVIKGRRAAAQAQMMTIADRQQHELLANRSYADQDTLEANGYDLPADVSKFYTYTVTVETAPPAFLITFTPKSGGEQSSDGELTLSNTGVKTPSSKW